MAELLRRAILRAVRGGWLIFGVLTLMSGTASAQEGGAKERVRRSQEVPEVWNQGALGEQAGLLAGRYRAFGRVTRLRPRLLDHQRTHPINLARGQLSGDPDSCLTIATLAPPNLSYLLLFESPDTAPARRAWPVPSAAGAAEVTRCGARKSLLATLGVKLRSRRGAVEFIVVESMEPPPPISELVPGRNPGPSLASPQVGPRPWLAPLKTRLAQLETQHRRDGAKRTNRSSFSADVHGRGSTIVHLDPGCHRLELLAESDSQSPPDLDARLFTLTRGTQLTSDEEHRGQVRLEHCVGRAERVQLDFSGARPHAELTLLHSGWDLPSGIPIAWGPLSRGRLAQAAWRDGLGVFDHSPIASALGVRGTTSISAELAPGACYVVVLAPIRGDVSSVALAARVGSTTSQANALDGNGVTLSFCANGQPIVSLETQAIGSGLAWIMGIWRAGVSP